MFTKICPVCKKAVEITSFYSNRPRLALHGPGDETSCYCKGSGKQVKVPPSVRKKFREK